MEGNSGACCSFRPRLFVAFATRDNVNDKTTCPKIRLVSYSQCHHVTLFSRRKKLGVNMRIPMTPGTSFAFNEHEDLASLSIPPLARAARRAVHTPSPQFACAVCLEAVMDELASGLIFL